MGSKRKAYVSTPCQQGWLLHKVVSRSAHTPFKMLRAIHIAVHVTVFVLAYLCALNVLGLMPLWEASHNDAIVPRKLVWEIQIC